MTTREFNTCVDLFSDNLYRFILKNLKDKDKSSDIVQDSFEKLWIRVDEVQFDKSKSYLFTTAYHLMIDLLRHEKKQGNFNEVKQEVLIHNNQYSDLGEILDKGLEMLPEIQRSVILLRDYEGYSYEEIGKITELNESQVKVYIYRARLFLKNYIGSPESVI
jgi:RNA polymerase sigma-70 factor (ECF subfamily)